MNKTNVSKVGFSMVVVWLVTLSACTRVGVVSFESMLTNTRMGRRRSADITQYFKTKQNAINLAKRSLQYEEKRIRHLYKLLEVKKKSMPQQEYNTHKQLLEVRYRELLYKGQKLMQHLSKENSALNNERERILKPLRQLFLKAVKKVAKEKGLHLVMEKSAVYHSQKTIDITKDVRVRIDAASN